MKMRHCTKKNKFSLNSILKQKESGSIWTQIKALLAREV